MTPNNQKKSEPLDRPKIVHIDPSILDLDFPARDVLAYALTRLLVRYLESASFFISAALSEAYAADELTRFATWAEYRAARDPFAPNSTELRRGHVAMRIHTAVGSDHEFAFGAREVELRLGFWLRLPSASEKRLIEFVIDNLSGEVFDSQF